MAEPTVEIVWPATGQQAAVIGNGTIIRPISPPDNWTTLKLSMRFALSGSLAGNLGGTPLLYFGFCSGSKVIGDINPDFFIGYRSNTATWTYTSSSTYTREYWTYTDGRFIANIGGNVTSSGDIMAGTNYVDKICGVFKPGLFNLIITRSLSSGTNNYRMIGGYVTDSDAYNGYSQTNFLRDNSYNVNFWYSGMSALTGYALPDVGFSGGFDNVLVSWDREEPSVLLTVLDIAYSAFME
jgi:hypothetical protein